jgi:hypothetical protein
LAIHLHLQHAHVKCILPANVVAAVLTINTNQAEYDANRPLATSLAVVVPDLDDSTGGGDEREGNKAKPYCISRFVALLIDHFLYGDRTCVWWILGIVTEPAAASQIIGENRQGDQKECLAGRVDPYSVLCGALSVVKLKSITRNQWT